MTTPLSFYLGVFRPRTVYTGRVATVSSAYPNNLVTANSVSSLDTPLIGETISFGTSSGGSERGDVRIRSYTGGSETFLIAEDSAVGPSILVNDYITVKEEFRLWPIFPLLTISGTHALDFEDYDLTYNGDNLAFPPMAVIGPPAAVIGSGQVKFVGDRSYTLTGNGMTYAWSAPDSVELTSSAQGTSGSPVIFTFNTAGTHRVSLTVTDSGNSKTATAYTFVFVFSGSENAATQSSVYTNFEQAAINGDYSRGGHSAQFTVHGISDVSAFPSGTLVVLFCTGDLTTRTATWPFRENILFVGYITKNSCFSVPEYDYVQFEAATIDELMRDTAVYPITITDAATPADWRDMSSPTINKLLAFLARQRSTLSMMAPMVPMSSPLYIWKQDFGPGNLWSQMDGLAQDYLGHICCSAQGVLYVERNYNLMLTAERASVTSRKTLTNADWVNRLQIEEIAKWAQPASSFHADGIAYPGGAAGETAAQALISLAPGLAQAPTGHPQTKSKMVLENQAELNARSGLLLGQANNPYPRLRTEFINEGSFDCAPQEKFFVTTDHQRITFSSKTIIPRSIKAELDNVNGIIKTNVEFETESFGATGVTILIPAPTSTPGPSPRPGCPPANCPSGWHWDSTQCRCIKNTGGGFDNTWRSKVYLSTASKGVFYTSNFASGGALTGSQPTWTAINTGLDTLVTVQMCGDPYAPQTYQWVIAGTGITNKIFLRSNGGSWVQNQTAVQFSTAINNGHSYTISSIIPNINKPAGYLGVVVTTTGTFGLFGIAYFFETYDYGTSWSAPVQMPVPGQAANFSCGRGIFGAFKGTSSVSPGDVLVVPYYSSGSQDIEEIAVSTTAGASWSNTTPPFELESSGPLLIDPSNQDIVYLHSVGLRKSTDRTTTFGSDTAPSTSTIASWYGLNIVYNSAGNGVTLRLMSAGRTLYKSTNGGSSFSTILTQLTDEFSPGVSQSYGVSIVQDSANFLYFICLGSWSAAPGDGHIFASADEGVTVQNKSGADTTSSTTTGIPYDCGGITDILQVWTEQ